MLRADVSAYETDLLLISNALFNVLWFKSADFEFIWFWKTANKGVHPLVQTLMVFLTLIYKLHGGHNAAEIDREKSVGGDARLYAHDLYHLVTIFDEFRSIDHIVFIRAQINIFFIC